jgi:hypothetical protein
VKKNNIETKAIPPKLLCPYLENASLEDDEDLQDKWAILLMNMVDSTKNVQNHVFPYILSQLSKTEFNILESTLETKEYRVDRLKNELNEFLEDRNAAELKVKNQLSALKAQYSENQISSERAELKSKIRRKEFELRSFSYRDSMLRREIKEPEKILAEDVEEFEIANIVRLGLAKVIFEASAGSQAIDIPSNEQAEYTSVDFDIDIDMDVQTILTELGELFINACREKRHTV